MTQDDALAILKTGANVFLTGEPGSGKTHTINRFVAWLREHGIEPAVTASTGIAATHINGHTIHSWSGIGIRRELTKYDLGKITGNKRVASRIRAAHTLIIDEISMLSAQTLALAETACRAVRESTATFGGLQVVLVGDFFQLPPIVPRVVSDEGELPVISEGDELGKTGGQLFAATDSGEESLFAFNSPVWQTLNLTTCYLSEQYRQDDPVFLEILSAIRSGTVSAKHRALLETRLAQHGAEGITQFFSHNIDVDRINTAKLFKLPGDEHKFIMEKQGPKNIVDRLTHGCLSPETLKLKIGAKVMFTKNDILRHRFVNGTLGEVIGFSQENDNPIIKTNSGHKIIVETAAWSVEDAGRVIAGITQIPLRLAWAITVHKSQGMSLDAAHMDLRDSFEHGQGYVAISRVRTLAGLSLAGWNDRALEVHPDIATQDVEFRAASRKAQQMLSHVPASKLAELQNKFIKTGGGKIEDI